MIVDPRRLRGANGFTLVELLVVLVLLSLAMGAMAVAFHGSGPRPRAAAAQLAAELRRLRQDAVANQAVTAATPQQVGQLLAGGLGPRLATRLPLSFEPDIPTLFSGASQRMLFFPDGSSSGGAFRLGSIEVRVNWIDGAVSVHG